MPCARNSLAGVLLALAATGPGFAQNVVIGRGAAASPAARGIIPALARGFADAGTILPWSELTPLAAAAAPVSAAPLSVATPAPLLLQDHSLPRHAQLEGLRALANNLTTENPSGNEQRTILEEVYAGSRMTHRVGDLSRFPRSKTAVYADLPPNGLLQNARVRIVRKSGIFSGEYDKKLGYIAPVTIPPTRRGDFVYREGSDNFVWLNAFYHANETLKHFERLGYVHKTPLTVLVDIERGSAPLYEEYSADSRGKHVVLVVGSGIKGEKDRRQNPVVISHEIFHIVFFRMHVMANSFIRDNPVTALLNEAFADYFSKSLHDATGPMRDISRYPATRPENAPLDTHYLGHVLAHELWELRRTLRDNGLSAFQVDRAIFQALEAFSKKKISPEQLYFDFVRRIGENIPAAMGLNVEMVLRKFSRFASTIR